jgi:hypothetical protein
MASRAYGAGMLALVNRTVDYLNDTIEVVIVKSTYTHDPDHTGATPAAAEITNVAGYVGGFGGAGRKVLAGKTITYDPATDRVIWDAADPSVYTLGTGDDVNGVVIQKKGSASDATAIPLWFLDVVDFPTNGGTWTLTFDAQGIDYIQI